MRFSPLALVLAVIPVVAVFVRRSEEHTSELQSQFHLVCRLLLEKIKNHCSKLQRIVHRLELEPSISCTVLGYAQLEMALCVGILLVPTYPSYHLTSTNQKMLTQI